MFFLHNAIKSEGKERLGAHYPMEYTFLSSRVLEDHLWLSNSLIMVLRGQPPSQVLFRSAAAVTATLPTSPILHSDAAVIRVSVGSFWGRLLPPPGRSTRGNKDERTSRPVCYLHRRRLELLKAWSGRCLSTGSDKNSKPLSSAIAIAMISRARVAAKVFFPMRHV